MLNLVREKNERKYRMGEGKKNHSKTEISSAKNWANIWILGQLLRGRRNFEPRQRVRRTTNCCGKLWKKDELTPDTRTLTIVSCSPQDILFHVPTGYSC